jgi:hypothetical protein
LLNFDKIQVFLVLFKRADPLRFCLISRGIG